MAVGTAICPTCGKSFSIDSSMVGQSVACPWCGEEIYMEGVDAPLEVDVPMGILQRSPSSTNTATENIPRNDTSRLAKPSDVPGADAVAPNFNTDGNASRLILGQPLKIVILVSVVVVAVVAGCWMALRRGSRNDGEDEPAPSEIHYFAENRDAPTESQADGGDEPAAEREEVEEENGNIQPDGQTPDGVLQDPPAATQANGGRQDMPVAMQAAETNLSTQADVPEPSLNNAETDDDDADPFEEAERKVENEVADDKGADVAALALDASPLIDAYGASGIDSYKCKTFVRDFAKTIAAANTNAVARRADLDTKARVYLKAQMEKAQEAGNLSQVLAYQTALESARRGKIIGEDATIRKLRESYAKQLVLTDKALLTAGRNAARALHANFGYQKVEATKKGEIDKATRIEAFQKEIEEWTKRLQEKAMPAPQEPKRNNDRPKTVAPTVMEEKTVIINAESRNGTVICSAMRGDTIEVKYKEGRWTFWRNRRPFESPDSRQVSEEKQRCALIRQDDPSTALAIVPYDTEHKVFSYDVQEDGTFALRINDGPEAWDFDDNTGSVSYAVRLIRGNGTQKTSADLRQSQGGQTSRQLSKTVTVDARDSSGAAIGTVRRGDTVEIRYEGGKWTHFNNNRPRESPDAKEVFAVEQRCVIVKRYNPRWCWPFFLPTRSIIRIPTLPETAESWRFA